MELDGRQYPVIYNARYRLPQDLHQSNPYEVGALPLGDYRHRLPVTQLREISSSEGRIYDGDDLLPVYRVELFLPHCRTKPHPEVFLLHARRTSGTM